MRCLRIGKVFASLLLPLSLEGLQMWLKVPGTGWGGLGTLGALANETFAMQTYH